MKEYAIEGIYAETVKRMDIGIKNNTIYVNERGFWERKEEQEFVRMVYGLFQESERGGISDHSVREVAKRLLNNPDLQIEFTDEKNEEFLNLRDGVFDILLGAYVEDEELNFSYRFDFQYLSEKERYAPNFEKFVATSFPDEMEDKRMLLLQIIGYVISGFRKAKAAFFLIGESNSGKSTILELIRKIMPPKTVTAIPLQRLQNPFNLAKLSESKLNICTELSESSLKSVAIFKQLTSNEVVTAEHKGGKPFEFVIRCKSLNAGNMLPDLEMAEGMEAVLNRMVILFFPRSIPKEEQDLDLTEKLFEEKDSIFSMALDELRELVLNNLEFKVPSDTASAKEVMYHRSHVFENFLQEMCEYDQNGKIHIALLYEKFLGYISDNLLDVKMKKNVFAQKVYQLPHVERAKFRFAGSKPRWGVIGIKLKEHQ